MADVNSTQAVATVDTEAALSAVKQVESAVAAIAQRASVFQGQVFDVYKDTNMPVVNQIYDSTLKLEESMKLVRNATTEVLAIMTKYANAVDEIANDSDGFEGL